VSQAFTPRAVDALRPTMQATAHELIDGFAAHGACEFMAAFADPYPSRIIAALLGIPRERYPQFHGWATDLGLLFSYAVVEHRPRIEAALLGLAACVDDLLAERRAAPGPDLISALIAVEESGDQLSDTELRHLVTGLVFAGQDTTRNQLGCALATFLAHPAQWARLADAPALAAQAVEEVMRVRPAVPVISRVATEDFDFNGLWIPAGTLLSLFVASANADHRVFGTDGFDITRERPAQLTFGGGLITAWGRRSPERRWRRRCRSWQPVCANQSWRATCPGGRRWASLARSRCRSASAPRPSRLGDTCGRRSRPCASGSGSTFSHARRGDRTIAAWPSPVWAPSCFGSPVVIIQRDAFEPRLHGSTDLARDARVGGHRTPGAFLAGLARALPPIVRR
jgi:hypothetical protein